MRRKKGESLGKNKGSKKPKDPSGFRAFPYLTPTGIQDLTDHRARHKISVTEEFYTEYQQQLLGDDVTIHQLVAYRAVLKARIAAWQSWSATMTIFKFTVAATVLGVLGPFMVTGGRQLLKLLGVTGISILEFSVIPFMIVALWLIWGPLQIVGKIERGTFVLEILDNVIVSYGGLSTFGEAAATIANADERSENGNPKQKQRD